MSLMVTKKGKSGWCLLFVYYCFFPALMIRRPTIAMAMITKIAAIIVYNMIELLTVPIDSGVAVGTEVGVGVGVAGVDPTVMSVAAEELP